MQLDGGDGGKVWAIIGLHGCLLDGAYADDPPPDVNDRQLLTVEKQGRTLGAKPYGPPPRRWLLAVRF